MEASHALKGGENVAHACKIWGKEKGVAKTQMKLLWGFFLGLDFFIYIRFFLKKN